MNLDETMIFLKEKFSKTFTYKFCENTDDFIPRFNLYADDKLIGIITNPGGMYQDICYMFGNCNDDFHNDVIKPCNFKLPKQFKNIYEFAENEIKSLIEESVKEMLNKK